MSFVPHILKHIFHLYHKPGLFFTEVHNIKFYLTKITVWRAKDFSL